MMVRFHHITWFHNQLLISSAMKEFKYKSKFTSTIIWDPHWHNLSLCFRSFQYRGILCRHALSVLRQEIVMLIPNKYIITRWRKDYKRLQASMVASSLVVPPTQDSVSYDDLYQQAHSNFLETLEFGCGARESMEHTISVLKETMDKVYP